MQEIELFYTKLIVAMEQRSIMAKSQIKKTYDENYSNIQINRRQIEQHQIAVNDFKKEIAKGDKKDVYHFLVRSKARMAII